MPEQLELAVDGSPGLLAIIVLALVASPSIILAGPAGHLRLVELTKQSDAIVIGRPEQMSSQPSGVSITMHAIRVLKGAIMPGDLIQCVWVPARAAAAPGSSPSPEAEGLWFLRAGENGQWQVMAPMNGDVPFPASHLHALAEPPAGAFAYSAGVDPFEKVISEIGSALQGSARRLQLMPYLFAGALDAPDSSVPRRMYAQIATSPIAALRVLGLQALIRIGDPTALQGLVADTDALSEMSKQPFLATAVCDFRSTQRAAVLELGRIVDGGAPKSLKVCAAHALRAIHTRDSLPALASLLDADSSELRYAGVVGLASFANSLPVETVTNVPSMGHMHPAEPGPYKTDETLRHLPAVPVFAADEARYLGFWKAWWAAHRAELSF